jgi:hypothetical protein
MLERILEHFERVRRVEDLELREQAEFLDARFQTARARLRHTLRSLRAPDRASIALVIAGLTLTIISVATPSIGELGDGYLMRAGILIAGIGLHRLLRP